MRRFKKIGLLRFIVISLLLLLGLAGCKYYNLGIKDYLEYWSATVVPTGDNLDELAWGGEDGCRYVGWDQWYDGELAITVSNKRDVSFKATVTVSDGDASFDILKSMPSGTTLRIPFSDFKFSPPKDSGEAPVSKPYTVSVCLQREDTGVGSKEPHVVRLQCRDKRVEVGPSITGNAAPDGSEGVFIAGRAMNWGIESFWISDHEVTQAEYETYCTYNDPSPDVKPDAARGKGPNFPAYAVNWYDALVYCNLRSMAEGLAPCYTINGSTDPDDWGPVPSNADDTWNAVDCNWEANGYRLPTEAEWEYAARGGDPTKPDWNYTYAGSDTEDDVAWYSNNAGSMTHPVKDSSKKPNALGLYDMSGNVGEFCWDWNATIEADTLWTGGDRPSPPASSSGDTDKSNMRMVRGGSWETQPNGCRVSRRIDRELSTRNTTDGFRVARTVK